MTCRDDASWAKKPASTTICETEPTRGAAGSFHVAYAGRSVRLHLAAGKTLMAEGTVLEDEAFPAVEGCLVMIIEKGNVQITVTPGPEGVAESIAGAARASIPAGTEVSLSAASSDHPATNFVILSNIDVVKLTGGHGGCTLLYSGVFETETAPGCPSKCM